MGLPRLHFITLKVINSLYLGSPLGSRRPPSPPPIPGGHELAGSRGNSWHCSIIYCSVASHQQKTAAVLLFSQYWRLVTEQINLHCAALWGIVLHSELLVFRVYCTLNNPHWVLIIHTLRCLSQSKLYFWHSTGEKGDMGGIVQQYNSKTVQYL